MIEAEPLRYHVQGSQPEPYQVEFWREDGAIQASCTCPAGENGQFCKHRKALIDGDVSAVVSGDLTAVPLIRALMAGTEAEAALAALNEAERRLEVVKRDVSARKHAVHRLLG